MDCEYVLSSMAELGEITPVEYSVAMHHEPTYRIFRDIVDNNRSFEFTDVAREVRNSLETMDEELRTEYYRMAATDADRFLRTISGRVAEESTSHLRDSNIEPLAVAAEPQIEISPNVINDSAITSNRLVIYTPGSSIHVVSNLDSVDSVQVRYTNVSNITTSIISRYNSEYQILRTCDTFNGTYIATNNVTINTTATFSTCGTNIYYYDGTNIVCPTVGEYIPYDLERDRKDRAIKNRLKVQSAKSAIKKALKLIDGIGFGKEISVFLQGDSIEVSHDESDLKFVITKYNNSLIDKTINASFSTPYKLELYTKSNVYVANLCVYIKDTPILDQVLAIIMYIRSGSEQDVLNKANFFKKTTDESLIDSLLMTHPYLAKKFRDRSGNNLDSFGICTPEHTEYINIYNRVNEDISQQLQQIIVNQNEYSL